MTKHLMKKKKDSFDLEADILFDDRDRQAKSVATQGLTSPLTPQLPSAEVSLNK